MKYLIAILSIMSAPVLSLGATVCTHKVKEIDACAQVEWKLGPKYGIFSKAIVTLKDSSGAAPKSLPELEFYPWMIMEGGHEHGARETVTKESAPGVYEVSMIHLMKMPGRWELRIKKKGKKSSDDALVSIPIEIK